MFLGLLSIEYHRGYSKHCVHAYTQVIINIIIEGWAEDHRGERAEPARRHPPGGRQYS